MKNTPLDHYQYSTSYDLNITNANQREFFTCKECCHTGKRTLCALWNREGVLLTRDDDMRVRLTSPLFPQVANDTMTARPDNGIGEARKYISPPPLSNIVLPHLRRKTILQKRNRQTMEAHAPQWAHYMGL